MTPPNKGPSKLPIAVADCNLPIVALRSSSGEIASASTAPVCPSKVWSSGPQTFGTLGPFSNHFGMLRAKYCLIRLEDGQKIAEL